MSTKKKTTTKKNKKKSTLITIIRFLRSEKGRYLTGVCFTFFALFMLIGMISFFFTGAED